jgi:hypothetical protein
MSDEDFYKEIESALNPNYISKKENTIQNLGVPFEEYCDGVNETLELARSLGISEFSCEVKGLPKKIKFDVEFVDKTKHLK